MRARLSRWRRVGHRAGDQTLVSQAAETSPFDVLGDDPLLAHLQRSPGTIGVDDLDLDSPALEAMRAAGVDVVVPLVANGKLIGVLNLGARRSERAYSIEDRRLLDNLAGNAAAAIRVAQLVRRQAHQARDRARIDQELKVAQLIQHQFLPQEVPKPDGWSIAPYYRPAREVGGDFYDFIPLPDGRLGIVVGDVTDKGVPAAMVMATTHSILRTDAPRLVDPGAVLARANDLLCAEMPPKMFVTCLYAVLEPATGQLRFANAGHNLPCIHTAEGVVEPRATGMPLGLMPGLVYDEQEVTIAPGSTVLLYSDGIVEAHNPEGELFGFPRLRALVAGAVPDDTIVEAVLDELDAFTGRGWEQEDDITIVALSHDGWRQLATFELPSDLGNERIAADRVAEAVGSLGMADRAVDRLRTAVAEAAMNAIEHGNQCQSEIPVEVSVSASPDEVAVRVVDRGGAGELGEAETPDIEAKLAGLQTPRGWGVFLMKELVDTVEITTDGDQRSVELVIRRDGERERAG